VSWAMSLRLTVVASLLALAPAAADAQERARATFAGGCFWCMEPPFDKLDGVVSTTSGYTGGHKANPTYAEVSAGTTGHAEAVEIVYDPRKVTYARLLEVFWRNVDPTTPDRQFCDVGSQYRAAIFFHDETQRRLAEESKQVVAQRLQQPVVTQVVPAVTFYVAEEYHQDFYRKNPIRYKFYRTGCGRDRRLEQLWGKAAGLLGPAPSSSSPTPSASGRAVRDAGPRPGSRSAAPVLNLPDTADSSAVRAQPLQSLAGEPEPLGKFSGLPGGFCFARCLAAAGFGPAMGRDGHSVGHSREGRDHQTERGTSARRPLSIGGG
jgi:peptide-methionine (S)-S-oxide reductase